MVEQGGRGSAGSTRVIFKDLVSAYDSDLEGQLFAGTGGTGPYAELQGVLSLTGITNVTYTDGSPTATEMYASIGQTLGAAVAGSRKARPQAIFMRFGRWCFFVFGEDVRIDRSACRTRPQSAPITPDGVPDPVGALGGVPVFSSEAIPVNLGAGGNQDAIIACRPSDMILFEGSRGRTCSPSSSPASWRGACNYVTTARGCRVATPARSPSCRGPAWWSRAMSSALEDRVAALEEQVAQLRRVCVFLMLPHGLANDSRGYGFDVRRMRAEALGDINDVVKDLA